MKKIIFALILIGLVFSSPQAEAVEGLSLEAQHTASVLRAIVVTSSTPYVWGGEDITSGLDCSSFTRYIMSNSGYEISRVTFTQAEEGERVENERYKVGDLLFFNTEDDSGTQNLGHVGVYLHNNTMVHMSSRAEGLEFVSLAEYEFEVLEARRILEF